jgi:cytochrome c oxidase subunit II
LAPLTARRIASRSLAPALIALAVAASPAGALQLAPDAPHSPNAEDMQTAYWVMLVLAVVIAAAINAALIGALVRFRERRGRMPERIAAGRGIIGRVGGAFAVLAVAIFVFGVVMTDSAREVEPSGPEGLTAALSRTAQVGVSGVDVPETQAAETATAGEEPPGGEQAVFVPEAGQPLAISAIGQQWLWRFEYPGGIPGQRTFSYNELVVPVDTAVVLNVDSTDVIHTWWVPALGGQVQAVPGDISQTWFKADEAGTYVGGGTVFNGTSYPAMVPRVRVVDAEEYTAYVQGLADDLAKAQETVRDEIAAASEAQAAAEEKTP